MRYAFLTLWIFALTQVAFAQSEADLESLREAFGDQKVEWLMENRPERAAFMAFQNRHGYYAAEVPPEKQVEYTGDANAIEPVYPGLPPVTDQLIENNLWNMLGYDLEPSSKYRYYRMTNGRVLVVLPESLTRRLYEKQNAE